ncbi:hypothetical protein T10_1866 [Trichinella papuae]|uniref:Uncharacterized protein n=1 Tax=Trichinella papuae TaxID=268474 RepID=A0A0V1MFR2_9BILA|nr:hypothetical protein T10_1866 [Trichinella papuae]
MTRNMLPTDANWIGPSHINNEVDHGTALQQKFQNFNALEGFAIIDKSLGLGHCETEDLEQG